jgi:hypothetical protein
LDTPSVYSVPYYKSHILGKLEQRDIATSKPIASPTPILSGLPQSTRSRNVRGSGALHPRETDPATSPSLPPRWALSTNHVVELFLYAARS